MADLTLPSPAKINLFLHVVGRRADGYHLLQTAFQFLTLSDQLTFSVRTDSAIVVNMPATITIPIEQNLIYRAARLLQAHLGTSVGATITVNKVIPLGGGLGGASSNAATTLLALNQLWSGDITHEALLKLGLSLGADVPIFLYGKAAFAEGVGEELQPITPPEAWIVLLRPDVHVATAKIFSDRQLTRTSPKITIAEFFAGSTRNDCEPIVREHFPEVASALTWLGQYGNAKLTGTGGCVFATFKDKETALKVMEQVPDTFNGIVVKGVNQSPLHGAISSQV
jgi:4-diphosphocytidyl-2-C-methyl-D-erythritol kinase